MERYIRSRVLSAWYSCGMALSRRVLPNRKTRDGGEFESGQIQDISILLDSGIVIVWLLTTQLIRKSRCVLLF